MADVWRRGQSGLKQTRRSHGGHKTDTRLTHGGQAPGTRPEHVIPVSKRDAPPGAAWRFLFSALDTRFRCGATESTLPKKSIAKCFYWPNFRSMVLPS